MKNNKTVSAYQKALFQGIGGVCVVLAMIGALLPIMPTTVFLILALGCFMRASPAKAQQLLNHPKFGHTLTLWQQQRGITQKAKYAATFGILTGFGLFLLTRPSMTIALLVAVIQGCVLLYILTRPSS